jgi:DNA-nicking Smr family endonuclease
MSRRRPLSDEEHALWTGIARSIKPLRRKKTSVEPSLATDDATAPSAPSPPRAAARPITLPPSKPLPLAPFDRRQKQRVARGRDAIDARIDLHGMTQSEAHGALLRFLRRAQADGARIALVVTGKGMRKGGDNSAGDFVNARGVLKRQVPLWLSLPEFRPFIVGFEDAHVSHGGQGALYLRLRRAR